MPQLNPRPKHIKHLTNSLDPATLIGKHVIGFMDDYPLTLTLLETPSNPLNIYFGGSYGGGKNFEYMIDDHLRSALENAAASNIQAEIPLVSSNPARKGSNSNVRNPQIRNHRGGVKIVDAHTAEVTKRYLVPVNEALPQHNGKLWHDKITLTGIQLEGMDSIGYFWGEDTEGGWEEFCLYCGTFIATEEQKIAIEGVDGGEDL